MLKDDRPAYRMRQLECKSRSNERARGTDHVSVTCSFARLAILTSISSRNTDAGS